MMYTHHVRKHEQHERQEERGVDTTVESRE
jgi:hypothetical protein